MSRARILRGGLVGGCSALLAVTAHGLGGGGLPGGGAVALVLVLCAGVGAATAVFGRGARPVLMLSLAVGQGLGHLALAAAGHHGAPAFGMRMLAAHAVATVVLGVLIGLAEHLFAIAESVLGWLRLIVLYRSHPVAPARHRHSNPVVVESILLSAGLGMRAPPSRSFI